MERRFTLKLRGLECRVLGSRMFTEEQLLSRLENVSNLELDHGAIEIMELVPRKVTIKTVTKLEIV